MNRRVYQATLLVVCLLWNNLGMAQMATSPSTIHQHAGATINGTEHPEKISDHRAWLMQLIASTSAARDSEQTKKHAALHSKIIGLPLQDFRDRYEKLIAGYNRARKPIYTSKDPAQIAEALADQGELYDQLQSDIDLLTTDMIAYVQRNTDAEHWTKLNDRIQESKSRMTFSTPNSEEIAGTAYHPLKSMARLLRVSQDFAQQSSSGYTTYTAVDTDTSYWYSTVYLYGAWQYPPTCTYNSYTGVWEPPSCPDPTHNMVVTNQINGAGPTNVDLGYYAPTQYVSFATSNQQAHGSGGNDNIAVAVIVNCSVAGVILAQGGILPWTVLAFLIKYFVKYGYEFVAYNGQGTIGACGVVNTCTNSRPWAIDIDSVIVGNGGCRPAWVAIGLCGRLGPGFSWNCTYDSLAWPLGAPYWGVCTPHP